MNKKEVINFYCNILKNVHWIKAEIVIKELEKALKIKKVNNEK